MENPHSKSLKTDNKKNSSEKDALILQVKDLAKKKYLVNMRRIKRKILRRK